MIGSCLVEQAKHDNIRNYLAGGDKSWFLCMWCPLPVSDKHAGRMGTEELRKEQVSSSVPIFQYGHETLVSNLYSRRRNLYLAVGAGN
jgi:hypothetical protein